MPLEWTHDAKTCPADPCTGDTDCDGFPSIADRVDMARAAFQEYSEADGTSIQDFFVDVCMFLLAESHTVTTRELLIAHVHTAAAAWEEELQRIAGHWRKS